LYILLVKQKSVDKEYKKGKEKRKEEVILQKTLTKRE